MGKPMLIPNKLRLNNARITEWTKTMLSRRSPMDRANMKTVRSVKRKLIFREPVGPICLGALYGFTINFCRR